MGGVVSKPPATVGRAAPWTVGPTASPSVWLAVWLTAWRVLVPGLAAGESEPPGALVLSTMIGGELEDSVRDVAGGEPGYFYLTGGTNSPDLPVTPGAYDTSLDPHGEGGFGAHDVWVAKLAYDGTLVWCTYVGGPGYDRAYGIEVDATGVYVAGRAGVGFPTSANALQTRFAGDSEPNGAYGRQDGFVLKLSLDGSQLLWSTYLGGPGRGFARDLAIDGQGDVYVAMTAVGGVMAHVTPGAWQTSPPPGENGVVARIAGNGAQVVWASYLGGSGTDLVNPSIRVDALGRVFVAGLTDSSDFPTTAGAFQRERRGPTDMTLTGFSADGASLIFSTYFGGRDDEETETHGLALSPTGEPMLAAITDSDDLPGTAGGFQPDFAGERDGFVARFTAGGDLVAATYLGGSGRDEIEGVAAGAGIGVLVTGLTDSADFPLAGRPPQSANAGPPDAFVATLSDDLRTLVEGTYLGGGDVDLGRAAAVGADGALLVGGHTRSADFPVTDGSPYVSTGSGFDARDAAAVVMVPEPSIPLQRIGASAALCAMVRWSRRRRRRTRR